MLKNYFKITLRNLQRQKVYSFLNITGLAIGMACAILILLWVQDELSYDRFHQYADRIYRIVAEWKENSLSSARTPGKLAPAIKAEIPEIMYIARVMPGTKSAFRYEEKAFFEERLAYVDPEFFKMFSFDLLDGKKATVLENAGSLVITENIAQKYFESSDPVGELINWNNWADFAITGVLKNIPSNSHIQYDFFRSHKGVDRAWPGGYTWHNFIHETYVLLQEYADAEMVSRKITEVYFRNAPEMSAYLNGFSLQPLTDIYLNSEIEGSRAVLGDVRYIYIFSIVAIFVLLIACINFMNLSTARSMKRAQEVGLRKVVGANRLQLVAQFFGESLFMAFLAFLIALIVVELVLPTFNQLAGKNLSLYIFEGKVFWSFLTLIILTGIVAGSYPAIYLSAFKPMKIFHTAISHTTRRRFSFRNILVIIQFALSIALIIGAIIVHSQLRYMQTRNLGFDKDNIVYTPTKGKIVSDYEIVKNALLQDSNIMAVAARGSLPMVDVNNSSVEWEGKNPETQIVMENSAVDFDFFKLLDMEIIAGRDFSSIFATDATDAFIVNEEAAKLIGLEKIIGKRIRTQGKQGAIIGVVEDAHFKSLHHKIHPQIFYLMTNYDQSAMDLYGTMLIKIKAGKISEGVAAIEHTWKKFNPDVPLEYHFLDETIEKQYGFEAKVSAISDYFTMLAVVISCLGLFGLATFTAERRTKEIGIRKILGASVPGIVRLFNKEFVFLVIVANLLAWPIAWLAMHTWLQDFAYRIEIGWWIFALAGGLALLIAMVTVSSQAIKAALANPVEALRFE